MIFGIYGMHFHHIFIMNYIRNKLKKKKKKKKNDNNNNNNNNNFK